MLRILLFRKALQSGSLFLFSILISACGAGGSSSNMGESTMRVTGATESTIIPTNSSGYSWIQSTGTAELNMQSVWYRNGIIYGGGATGVYRSIDQALTFSASNTGNDTAGPTRAFTDDANYIYSSTSQGVYRSSDQGITWTARSIGMTELKTSGLLKVATRLYVVGPMGVFRSDNQGESWVSAGLVGKDVRCIAAIDDVVYVGTLNEGVFKSMDYGVTWTAINTGLAGATFRAIEAKGTTLFLGGEIGTGVYRSTNGGANWTLLSGGLLTSAYRGFASNDQFIVAGAFGTGSLANSTLSAGGVYYSRDNGNTWIELNAGLTDKAVFDLAITDAALIVATNTAGIFRIPLSALK